MTHEAAVGFNTSKPLDMIGLTRGNRGSNACCKVSVRLANGKRCEGKCCVKHIISG